MRPVLVTCAVAFGAGTASAAPVPERVVIVGRAATGGAWSDAPTEARADGGAQLAIVVVARDGKRRVVIADPDVRPLSLGGRAVPARDRRDAERLRDVRVRWSIVEPRGFRTRRAANGATSPFYSNVSTEPRDFGRWLGYDAIEYVERPVGAWRAGVAAWRIEPAISSGEDDAVQLPGLGTVRYKAELALPGGLVLATPGARAVDAFGILPSVHRVSLRRSDDFIGWLTSYLLVPEVFGSAGGGKNHQTERFTGGDCADILVGAMRRSGRRDVGYTNVAGLPRLARAITGPIRLDENGTPPAPITGVEVGDLIRIDYGGALAGHTPRGWDHVAALFEDRSDPDGPRRGGPDGRLDGFDLVIHMGHPRLKIEPLSEQSPATIDVLRWRER